MLFYVGACIGCFAALIGLTWVIGVVAGYEDYRQYLDMTVGRLDSVTEPFASRRLGPALAALLARASGLAPAAALALTVIAGWLAAAVAAGLILWRVGASRRWTWVLATVPFPGISAAFHLVPDSLTVALVLLFVLAVTLRSGGAALAASAAAMLARGTSALSILLWAPAWLWRRSAGVKILVGAAVGLILGALLKRWLWPSSAQNVHHMNGAVYLVAKTGMNAVRAFLGVQLYADTTDWCPRPAHVLYLHGMPGLGRIDAVGVCAFKPLAIVSSFTSYACILGVTPYVAVRHLIAACRTTGVAAALREQAPVVAFLFLFLLAPTLGSTAPRLFIEAYPLIFVVAPLCVGRSDLSGRAFAGALALNALGFALLSILIRTRF